MDSARSWRPGSRSCSACRPADHAARHGWSGGSASISHQCRSGPIGRQRLHQPPVPIRAEQRQNAAEVGLVLVARVLRLEQQRDFRCQVRDSVRCPLDEGPVRPADPVVAPVDPDIAVVRFPEHVEPPPAGRPLVRPRLMPEAEGILGDGKQLAPVRHGVAGTAGRESWKTVVAPAATNFQDPPDAGQNRRAVASRGADRCLPDPRTSR